MGLLKCRARREQSQYLLGARLLILSRQFWLVPTDAFSPQSGLFSAHRCARGSLAGARDWGRPQVFLSAALGLSPSGQSDLLGLWGSFLFSEPSSALFQALCPPQSSKTLRAPPRARALVVSSAALSPGHCARSFPSCAGPGLGWAPHSGRESCVFYFHLIPRVVACAFKALASSCGC